MCEAFTWNMFTDAYICDQASVSQVSIVISSVHYYHEEKWGKEIEKKNRSSFADGIMFLV